ncbi:MAG: DUF58 domain-containing protein [Magnetococcus sp. DMHC-6]
MSTSNPAFAGSTIRMEILIQLRHLATHQRFISAQKTVKTVLTGGATSAFRGRGIDFEEVRPYQPGDDIRNMDWRVTARTGHPYTKLFREERERPVLFLVDLNPSMAFGSRVAFKSVTAANATAILAWSASLNKDRVGGVVLTSQHHQECRPTTGQRGVLPLLHALCLHQPTTPIGTAGSLAEALARLRRVTRPGSLIFLISDFLALDDQAENHIRQLAQHNDLVTLFIHDSLEANLPVTPERLNFSNGQQNLRLDLSRSLLQSRYSDLFNKRRQYLKTLCQKNRIFFITLATHDPLPEGIHLGQAALLGRRKK